MKTTILNYRIIVEKEKQNKGFLCVAYAPSLGISDFGKTVDEATSNVKKAMQLYIETSTWNFVFAQDSPEKMALLSFL